MAKFKKGDRVKVVIVWPEDAAVDIRVGDTGVVLGYDKSPWVRMDKHNKKLLNAVNLCEDGHGWAFSVAQLELIEEETATQKVMTPLQEAIEKVQLLRNIDAVINPIGVFTAILNGLLEKEKAAMCQFQSDGQKRDFWVKYSDNEDCFNKTFKTK